MKIDYAKWLLKESVLKGDNPTQATVDLFLEKYNTLVGKRYVKAMKRVVAAIISTATFFLYFVLVALSHCHDHTPNDALESNILDGLSPMKHPWISTALLLVAALIGLGCYAQHLYDNRDKWL